MTLVDPPADDSADAVMSPPPDPAVQPEPQLAAAVVQDNVSNPGIQRTATADGETVHDDRPADVQDADAIVDPEDDSG